MSEPCELWRAVPGWEGLYEASSSGRVRSVSRLVTFQNRRGTNVTRWLTGRVMRPSANRHGYLGLMLSSPGEAAAHREVQTLVCAAFHGPRPDGMQAAHNNGDPSDNRPSNLRWATPSQNAADKARHGTLCSGEKHYAARLTEDAVRVIRHSPEAPRDIAAQFGISIQSVSKIRRHQAWKHVGESRPQSENAR